LSIPDLKNNFNDYLKTKFDENMAAIKLTSQILTKFSNAKLDKAASLRNNRP